jgi:hypothetical protein
VTARDRKIHRGWFSKLKTSEVARAKTAYVRTPLNVPTTLFRVDMPDESAAFIEASVIARQEDGAERAAYKVLARAHRQGGGAVVTAVDVVAPIESDAAWAATIVASGNAAILQVTGDAANAVRWRAVVSVQFVD